MRPAVPRSVRVGAHTYQVSKVGKAQMPELLGVCNFDGLTIKLTKGLRFSKQQEILLHECCHAALPEASEKFVDALAPVLLEVLQENPKLVEYLRHKG